MDTGMKEKLEAKLRDMITRSESGPVVDIDGSSTLAEKIVIRRRKGERDKRIPVQGS